MKPEAERQKTEIEAISIILKNKGANQPTINNICRILKKRGHAPFTSGDVVTILKCAQSTASDFVKKMRDKYGVIKSAPNGTQNSYCVISIEDILK